MMDDFEAYIRDQQQSSNTALTAPAQPSPVSTEDDFAQFVKSSRQADAQAVAAQNSAANPDASAKAAAIGKQIGMPQAAVETDVPRYQQQAAIQKNSQILSANPVLASWVAANPDSARIAQDDFDKLGFIDKTWRAITSGASEAITANQLGRLGSTKELAGAIGSETPNTDAQIAALQAAPKQASMNGYYGVARSLSGFITGLADNFVRGAAPGAVSGAAVGTLAEPGAGTAIGFGIGGITGFNADMARVAAGNAYLKMNMMRDSSGLALSEPAKQFGALFTGAATYALGTYGSGVVGKDADALAAKALDQALERPTFRAALSGFAKETAAGSAHGAAIMTGMEGSGIIGEELAKAMSPGDFKTDPKEIVDRLTDAAINGALTLGALHGAIHGIGLYGDIQNAHRAEAQMQAFKNIMDGATESKTHDRSTDAFQSFMQHQTDGTPQENLYIPAEKVREFYQSAGIDHDLTDRTQDPLFGFVADMPKQLEEAAQSGGDVVIPTADYVTHLAGTPVSDKLLPDIRLGANSMSVNEAKAFQAEHETRMKVALEEAAKEKAAESNPGQQIFQEIKQQILDAGRNNSEAEKVAAIQASRYVNRADRLGMDPLKLYQDEAPKIQGIDNPYATADSKTFNQSDVENKKILNSLNEEITLKRRANESSEDTISRLIDGYTAQAERAKNKGYTTIENEIRQKVDDLHKMLFSAGLENDPEIARRIKADDLAEEKAGWGSVNVGGEELPPGAQSHGMIQFDADRKAKPLISLFENASPSTLIHELGHSWLEELKKDAEREDAPEKLKNDWELTKQFLKNGGKELSRDQHEQFARTAEAYFMEGKAPSNDLAGVFRRFKTWLTKLYGIISNLRAPINDEIRGVFDRLIATDNEIASVKASQGLEPAFKSREDAGMTSAEWKAYNKDIDTANHQAESTLLEKMMKKVKRQRTAEYKEELSVAKEEAKTKVDQRPDIQALRLVTKGLMPDGSKFEGVTKLSRAEMERLYGKEGLADLPKGSLSKDGAHPDEIAEILGYRTGDDMVQALRSLEAQQREIQVQEGERRGIRQFLIDQEAERQIEAKHGDIMDEESMRDEALAAVHSEQQEELLATELRYLRRLGAQALEERGQARIAVKEAEMKARWDAAEADLTRQIEVAKAKGEAQEKIDALKQKIADLKMTERWDAAERNTHEAALKQSVAVTREMLQNMRDHVDRLMLDKSVKDIGDYRQYSRSERKAAREVQDAILRKDYGAAAQAKQRQIFNMILFSKMREASDRIDAGRRMMERLADKEVHKGIDQDYTNQIHDLINRFGFDSGRGAELQRTKQQSLEEFVHSAWIDLGLDLPVDRSLFDHPLTPFGELTYDEFNVLDLAVRSLREVGRLEKTITIDGEKQDFNEVRDRIVEAIRALGERDKSDYLNPKSAPALQQKKDALFSAFRGIDASLIKKESLFDQIDKNDPFGIMNTAIFRKLKEAQHNRDIWSERTAKDFKAAADVMPKGWLKSLRDDVVNHSLIDPETGRPTKLARKDMIGMALNWGNEGNIKRLVDGFNWDEGTAKAFLDANMSKADWDFVQKVWDIFDSYREPLDALQLRTTGVGLDMVKATPVDTPHGLYAGGYYPIVEDKSRSYRTESLAEKAAADSMFPNGYMRATTPHGNTISRVGGDRPISIDLDIAPWKIGQTIHDIAMREAIMDSDRLLSDPAVKKAFDDVFGPEYRKLMRPWLQNIANSRNIDDAAMSTWNRILSTARTNTVMVGIGFRAMTMFKHGATALSNSISELGAKWMMAGAKEFYGPGMTEKWNFIKEKSPEMAFRLKTYDMDTQQQYANLFKDGAYTKFQQNVQHFSHIGISYLDLGSAAPTWLGAYRKGLSENMSDADAVYYADKTVRNAHGAQGILDKAAIQEQQGAWALTTMFYGFFNHIYNRQRSIAIEGAQGVRNLQAGEYGQASRDFGSVLGRSWYYVAVPALIEAFAHSGGPNEDQDETWAGWASKAILSEIPAGIPVMRDIAKAVAGGRDYEMSPVVHAINTAVHALRDDWKAVFSDEETPKNLAKENIEAAGYLTGLPTAAPFATGKFLWDYTSGDVQPQDLSEWLQGIMTGKIKHE